MFPCCFSAHHHCSSMQLSSAQCLHQLERLPLSLVPVGFHWKTCLSTCCYWMRSRCPIKVQRLSNISGQIWRTITSTKGGSIFHCYTNKGSVNEVWIKTVTSRQICCRTTLWKVSGHQYSFTVILARIVRFMSGGICLFIVSIWCKLICVDKQSNSIPCEYLR